MPSNPRYWLIVLAMVLLGAAVRLTVPLRVVMPTTRVLADFPAQLGPYAVTSTEFPDSEVTRRAYAPAAIVYRDYSTGRGAPINLFVAPEPVGWDSPSICAAYRGSVITQLTMRRISAVPGLVVTEVVLRPKEGNQMNVCAYYWRGVDGPVTDRGVHLLEGKLAVLIGYSSFRVDMCMPINDVSEIASASRSLTDFAALADHEVQHLLREAIETGQ